LVAGLLIAYTLKSSNVTEKYSWVIALLLLIVWEIIERLFSVYEPIQNIMIDIVVGFLAFSIVFWLIPDFEKDTNIIISLILLVILLGLNFMDWKSWKDRGCNEADKNVNNISI
jgi:hypothetical protein